MSFEQPSKNMWISVDILTSIFVIREITPYYNDRRNQRNEGYKYCFRLKQNDVQYLSKTYIRLFLPMTIKEADTGKQLEIYVQKLEDPYAGIDMQSFI